MNPAPNLSEANRALVCVVCSACAGLGTAYFGCVLSEADRLKTKNDGTHTRRSSLYSRLGVIGSTVFGVGSLAGLAFGPINVVTVVRAGTLLPANVAFGQVFAMRPLVRDDILGTLIVMAGVVSFTVSAGRAPERMDEDTFTDIAFHPMPVIWAGCILLLLTVCSLWLQFAPNRSPIGKAIAISNINGCASAIMDVAAKGWLATLDKGFVYAVTSWLFWSALCINVMFLIIMRKGTIWGCQHTDILSFVPLNTVLNIFISASTGMVCLEEWENVDSWSGLVSASVSILAGVMMLVSGPADYMGDDSQTLTRSESKANKRAENKHDSMGILGPRPRAQDGSSSQPIFRRAASEPVPFGTVTSPFAASPRSERSAEDDDDAEDTVTESDSDDTPKIVKDFPCRCLFFTKSMALFKMNCVHNDAANTGCDRES